MSSLGEEAKDWLVSIVIAVVLAFFIREFIVELYIVDGPSMRPTLQSQERLVVNKFIYNFREPQKNEILVFEYMSLTLLLMENPLLEYVSLTMVAQFIQL